MPQRVLYDQLPLLLVAATGIEMMFLVITSWLTVPVLFTWGGWGQVPVNWQFWIVLTLYVPALLVLFWPDLVGIMRNIYTKRFPHPSNVNANVNSPTLEETVNKINTRAL